MSTASSSASIEDRETSSSYTYDRDGENLVELNSSYRLQISQCSSISSDSDLSFSTQSIERELNMYTSKIIDSDELPAFEIRLISPLGRTPSPIDSDIDFETPTRNLTLRSGPERHTQNFRQNNPDFVTLQDINAQISPPSDSEEVNGRKSSLETIFEGVFLNTPPRKKRVQYRRSNLLEKEMHYGKENNSIHQPLTDVTKTQAISHAQRDIL